jgi:hypothetical protein
MTSMSERTSIYPNGADAEHLIAQAPKFEPLPVNAHIHSPYSFSAFESVSQSFDRAVEEDVKVLGINDFIVRDGFPEFVREALRHRVFPLLNIEFMALLRREQSLGIRVNDPNNPGRTYFCGKGLDFPLSGGTPVADALERVKEESNRQTAEMVRRLNAWLDGRGLELRLVFSEVKARFARDLVRERHLAKALRHAVTDKYGQDDVAQGVLGSIMPDGRLQAPLSQPAAVDNELRGKLFKAGGPAFVEEDERAFLQLDQVITLIRSMGGIPCYPVLLDDAKGFITEYERDYEALYSALTGFGVGCIELIPGRNDAAVLLDFVHFFRQKGFVIMFGTEHNTPELIPLRVGCRNDVSLNAELMRVSYEGVCVVAAHQYLRSMGRPGFEHGGELPHFVQLGHAVIRHFIDKRP